MAKSSTPPQRLALAGPPTPRPTESEAAPLVHLPSDGIFSVISYDETFVSSGSTACYINAFVPGPMKHEVVLWNRSTQEWFCLKCGRTSDHAAEPDARTELEQHECKFPTAELPDIPGL
jgi:hypothetical protein